MLILVFLVLLPCAQIAPDLEPGNAQAKASFFHQNPDDLFVLFLWFPCAFFCVFFVLFCCAFLLCFQLLFCPWLLTLVTFRECLKLETTPGFLA